MDGLGDQAFAGTPSSGMGGADVIVRHGPVVFELSYDARIDGDLDEAIEALGALAERIIDALASQGY